MPLAVEVNKNIEYNLSPRLNSTPGIPTNKQWFLDGGKKIIM
jgi:hypothetical protein